ncbi:MAG: proteinase inhibitor [Burkholderiaceae bacterium]|nr:proteinase inhibitor [Burkholderiaceae bacterium]
MNVAVQEMSCRAGCGACCIAPSISSTIPDMPDGKPEGVPCVQLDAQMRCKIFGEATRPAVCGSLRASAQMCGMNEDVVQTREFALHYLNELELLTK